MTVDGSAAAPAKPRRFLVQLTLSALALLVWWAATFLTGAREIAQMLGAASREGVSGQFHLGELQGYAAGRALFPTLVVWAVLYFGFVRSRAPKLAWRHFLILLAFRGALEVFTLAFVMNAVSQHA